eukprot:CAMPEP_0172453126 /NCGR_PEP_ID=MMETSP1065-20121228/10587_1 /TAXON_ID=265537 /ORGANISM="Amphiprora paludosa, Strain CCMP125" /LENGTH=498 /DNA_ID=CAMNT_0013205295 /DNA_START=12 /DNA_END=1508 /DNA_ORIENTATION=-
MMVPAARRRLSRTGGPWTVDAASCLLLLVSLFQGNPIEAWTSTSSRSRAPATRISSTTTLWGTSLFDTLTATSPIMAAFEAHTQGQDALERGATNAAVQHYQTATQLHPTADRYFRWGHALEENGESLPAIDAFATALEMATDNHDMELMRDVHLKLAHLWSEHVGDYEQALSHVDTVLSMELSNDNNDDDDGAVEEDAVAMDQKAFFLAATGQFEQAIALWDQALTLKEAAPKGSRAKEVEEDAKLYRAMAHYILLREGDNEQDNNNNADIVAMTQEQPHKVESWNYVLQHPPTTSTNVWHQRLFSGTATLLQDALQAARPDGLICEFGVFHGKSIRLLASLVDASTTIDGFDTFEGIPEEWGDEPAGSYTAAAEIPQRCPANVQFHVGLFAETLPQYVQSTNPATTPVRLINVDCDLYQGTVEIMEFLAPRIGPGTVIVFDEYLMTPTWVDDEYKAFQEAVQKFGWEYEYLAYSLFSKQAVVRITKSDSFVGPAMD